MIKNLSIKSEVFYWGIIFFFIMAIVLGLAIARPNFYSMIKSAEDCIEDSSQYVNHFAEKAFKESDALLEILSTDDDVIQSYRNRQAGVRALEKYRMLSMADRDISYIYSGYEDGSILIEGYEVPEGFDSRDRPWYKGLSGEDGNRKVSYRDASSNEWLFSNSRAVYDGEGFIGVVSVDISSANLNSILGKGEKYDSQRSYIMDENFTVVIHPQENYIGKNFEDITKLKSNNIGWDKAEHFRYELDGKNTWAYYQVIDGTDYIVVTAIDEDEILGPIKIDSLRMILVIVTISIVLSVLFSKLIFKRIGSPIQKLGGRIDKIVRGKSVDQEEYRFSNPEVVNTAINVERIAMRFIESSNKSLEESERRYRRLVENLSGEYFLYIIDKSGKLEYVSPSVEEMLGFKPGEFLEDNRALTRKDLGKGRSNTIDGELEVKTFNGEKKVIEITEVLIRDKSGELVAVEGIAKDITEKKERQLEIEYLSFHDSMTGLYNRRFFEEELSRLDVSRNYPISILYGDINGLKLANDIFGHEVGDKLILTVSKIIKMECRSDDIISRIGGDEYAIILPNADKAVVEGIVDRIGMAIEREHLNGIVVSISFGWATKYREGEALEDVLKKADERMYKKKLSESPAMRKNTVELIVAKSIELGIVQPKIKDEDAKILEQFSKVLGLDGREKSILFESYRFRNIGKYALDKSILESTEKLDNAEWNSVKRHPELGYRILSATPKYEVYSKYILSHHESWDGTGYPDGLCEDEIPKIARVIAIVDGYSSMTEERFFRQAYDREYAISEIKEGSGKRYDPELVDFFLEILGD